MVLLSIREIVLSVPVPGVCINALTSVVLPRVARVYRIARQVGLIVLESVVVNYYHRLVLNVIPHLHTCRIGEV